MPSRRILLLAFLFSLGCNSGGGSGVGGGKALSGKISAFSSSDSVFEAEPNDSVAQAHFLGDFSAGRSISVFGSEAAPGDEFDAFILNATDRLEFDVSLQFSDPGTNDLDLYVYDIVGQQFVEGFISVSSPEVGNFHAAGSFLLVVNAFAGSDSYTLEITASAAADPILEREPNNDELAAEAQYLG
jgi:hypothetical protein